MRNFFLLLLAALLFSSCGQPEVGKPAVYVDGHGEYTISFRVSCPDAMESKIESEGNSAGVEVDTSGCTGWVHGFLHDPCDSVVVPIKVLCGKDTMKFSITVHSSGIEANSPSKVQADPNTGLFTFDLEIGCCDKEKGTFTISMDQIYESWGVTDLRATPSTIDCPGPGGIQHVSIVGKLKDLKQNGAVFVDIKGPHGECQELTRITGTK